jgi:hypothetical protein
MVWRYFTPHVWEDDLGLGYRIDTVKLDRG